MMKKICVLLIALFTVNTLCSQVLDKEGVVKGKYVTYNVREQKACPWGLYVSNAANTDGTEVEFISILAKPYQIIDLQTQVAEIIRRHLSAEELEKLKSVLPGSDIALRLRVKARKAVQVDWFCFDANVSYGEQIRARVSVDSVVSVDTFRSVPVFRKKQEGTERYDICLQLDADRLYEIEKAIISRVVLPEMLCSDYRVVLVAIPYDIYDIEKTRA